MAKLMIMGAGGMGTALAVAFSQMGHQVWLWGWSAEENAAIRAARENVPLLRGVKIPEAVEIVDPAEAAAMVERARREDLAFLLGSRFLSGSPSSAGRLHFQGP